MILKINARKFAITTLCLGCALSAMGFLYQRNNKQDWVTVRIETKLEGVLPNGGLFTPTTQSILRGTHALEKAERITLRMGADFKTDGVFEFTDREFSFELKSIRLDWLLPRLLYTPAKRPDAFDALNLRLAEYARNGLSVPVGTHTDEMAHFETDLKGRLPYSLLGDYSFLPNPKFIPLRVSLINNCLAPGAWEISARDSTGEIYHGWFTLPLDPYYQVVAQANGLSKQFVKKALAWQANPAPLKVDRLRRLESLLGTTPVALTDHKVVGYSSQGSRRKLQAGFIQVLQEGKASQPRTLEDMTRHPLKMPDFVLPGKYSLEKHQVFDLSFLRKVKRAHIRKVHPLTSYRRTENRKLNEESEEYIEIEIELASHTLLLGNLPLSLLVPQEDLPLFGFGAGIFNSNEPAERRKTLTERGPPPMYAYVTSRIGKTQYALNSHLLGVEQVFIRTHLQATPPHWEISITSYERIADLIRYRVDIPLTLKKKLERSRRRYITPLFRSYRDDNQR